jgi:hypothetical protein
VSPELELIDACGRPLRNSPGITFSGDFLRCRPIRAATFRSGSCAHLGKTRGSQELPRYDVEDPDHPAVFHERLPVWRCLAAARHQRRDGKLELSARDVTSIIASFPSCGPRRATRRCAIVPAASDPAMPSGSRLVGAWRTKVARRLASGSRLSIRLMAGFACRGVSMHWSLLWKPALRPTGAATGVNPRERADD